MSHSPGWILGCNNAYPYEFFTSVLVDGLSQEFQGQQSNHVSRTLLSILAVPNNPVVWMVSTRPANSKSSSPFNNPLVTVPKSPITIGIIVTFMFHSFFLSKVEVFLFLFTFFQFYQMVSWDSKVNNFANSLFCWLLLLLLLRVFHPSVCRRFFTEVTQTASLLRSPVLFSII